MTVDNAKIIRAADIAAADLADERAMMKLSFAQLLTGLVAEGWITNAEGAAWLTGALPASVTGLIGTLPTAQQFAATAQATAPSEVDRNNTLVIGLGVAEGRTESELDQFFRTYAAI